MPPRGIPHLRVFVRARFPVGVRARPRRLRPLRPLPPPPRTPGPRRLRQWRRALPRRRPPRPRHLGTPLPRRRLHRPRRRRVTTAGHNDLTTRSVGVGQWAEAEIRVNTFDVNNGGEWRLYLTANSTGTSTTANFDSEYIAIQNVASFNGLVAWHTERVPAEGFTFVTPSQPRGSTYRYRITRLSSTSARYDVFEGERLLGTMTRTLSGIPDDLYVAVNLSGSDITVRSVTVLPEPSAGFVAMGVSFLLLRRRGRTPE